MSAARYSEYKDSGVAWLGEVPNHWDLIPLKHLSDFVNGSAFKPDTWSDNGTPIIRIENLNGGDSFNYYEGDVDSKYHIEQGDLLFGWSGNRGTSFGPFLWPRTGRYFLNQHIFKVCNFQCHRVWFYWCLKAVTTHVEQQAHGIIGMVHVTKGDLGSIKVAVPPKVEQIAISALLDRETAKIDALVEEQEKLIALLKEKRQAVISHAVTKGIDPSVPTKDSSIEWLGEVPEHWVIRPLKRIAKFKSGESITSEKIEDQGRYPVFGGNGLRGFAEDYTHEGTFVLVGRQGALCGNINYASGKFWASEHAVVVSPLMLVETLWLGELLRAMNLNQYSISAAQPGLSVDVISNLQIPVPPVHEQISIAEYINSETQKFDSLMLEVEHAVELLKERRTAIISAAVIGKIDVRGLVAEEVSV